MEKIKELSNVLLVETLIRQCIKDCHAKETSKFTVDLYNEVLSRLEGIDTVETVVDMYNKYMENQ